MSKDMGNTANSSPSDNAPSLTEAFTLDATARSLAEKPITYERRAPDSDRLAYRRIHSEEAAFRAIDPHLAALHKDLKNYQSRYREMLETFGDDDPMLDIIADQLDSARSAYETRLIEIKRDHGMAAAGFSLYRNAREEYLDNKKREEEEEYEETMRQKWKEFAEHLERIQMSRQSMDERSNLLMWALVLALFFNQKPDYGLIMTQQRI